MTSLVPVLSIPLKESQRIDDSFSRPTLNLRPDTNIWVTRKTEGCPRRSSVTN